MKDLLLPLLHLAVTAAKLCRPGGVRAVIAENLLLKQQLIVLRRSRQRAPNLRVDDRLLCGFGALFLSPGRIRKVAIGLRPSTLLTFHQALVRGKYRRLFSASARPKKPGPKGPSESLIRAIVELKSRNPRFGCPRIARIRTRAVTGLRRILGLDAGRLVPVARARVAAHRRAVSGPPPPPGPQTASRGQGASARPYAVPGRTRRRGEAVRDAAGSAAWSRRRAGAACACCAR